jgi:hypothetical protein
MSKVCGTSRLRTGSISSPPLGQPHRFKRAGWRDPLIARFSHSRETEWAHSRGVHDAEIAPALPAGTAKAAPREQYSSVKRGDPEKCRGLGRHGSRHDPVRLLVPANQAVHSARVMCRPLGVWASGYYASRTRPAGHRALKHAAVGEEGTWMARRRIARFVRAAGVWRLSRRRLLTTSPRNERAPMWPDLVRRRGGGPFTTRVKAASTVRSHSVSAVALRAPDPRWVRSATASTTRCVRASSPPASASSSTGDAARRAKHGSPCSASSRYNP